MTENKIKYNSYENSFYINDDEGISQIIAPELIIEIINDYEKEIVKLKQKNKELKEKNKFILKQIKAFRDDCATYLDFDGVSTLNRLLDILGEEL